MSQKQILILVAVLFTLVAVGAIVNSRREAEIGDRLTRIETQELASVRFYKDPLRDSEGLDLPVEDPADLDALAAALHTLKPSSVTIKSLQILAETKITLELEPEDSLMLSVMRTAQTGEAGVVSIDRQAGPGSVPGGIFESAELLAWVEAMAARPGYEKIAEVP